MSKKSILVLVFVLVIAIVGGVFFYLSSKDNSYPPPGSFIPANWSKEEAKTKGNESLLYSNADRIESYKNSFGYYPENLNELASKGASFNNDIFSDKPARYSLSADKKSFDLRFTGPDGKFDTNDDVVFNPTRLADNLLPMYGGENAIKTPSMLLADKEFIDSFVREIGSREKASVGVTGGAREWLEKGDLDTAMKRFNQAWLLDPNNPEPYRGFAEILKRQGKTEEAERMLKLAQEKEATKR